MKRIVEGIVTIVAVAIMGGILDTFIQVGKVRAEIKDMRQTFKEDIQEIKEDVKYIRRKYEPHK
jgi:hypothetical protein